MVSSVARVARRRDVNANQMFYWLKPFRAFFQWQTKKPFLELRFVVLEPRALEQKAFSGRLYYTEKALWKVGWFLRDCKGS